MKPSKVDKKVAIVTGGAQGIGKAIVLQLLKQNIVVNMVDSDKEAGKEAEKELKPFGEVRFLWGDVSLENEVKKIVQFAKTQDKRIDYLINNAGVSHFKPLSKLTLKEWNQIIGTNLTSAFLFAKYAESSLRKSKGVIIHIASTRAMMSEPNTEAYSATKGGMTALTHALAMSLGPDVRVNCISPGWIETSLWKKKNNRHSPKFSKMDLAQHPVGRVGKPEDIAAMVSFLIADEAGFITGANFVVDGGMTRKMIYV
jgi:NAD(P)-dependent dehydrogenase (short-subunit alcohol dehydrogenase family)